jgi:hypothetical protein
VGADQPHYWHDEQHAEADDDCHVECDGMQAQPAQKLGRDALAQVHLPHTVHAVGPRINLAEPFHPHWHVHRSVHQCAQHVFHCGLFCIIGAEELENLALPHIKRHAVDGG